jgi:hypothetical protein
MWRNPITAKQIRVLEDDWGVKEEVSVTGTVRSIVGWFRVLMVSTPTPVRPGSSTLLTLVARSPLPSKLALGPLSPFSRRTEVQLTSAPTRTLACGDTGGTSLLLPSTPSLPAID